MLFYVYKITLRVKLFVTIYIREYIHFSSISHKGNKSLAKGDGGKSVK